MLLCFTYFGHGLFAYFRFMHDFVKDTSQIVGAQHK